MVGGYTTEEKAIQEALNYLVYNNPNYASMCQFSYSVGGVEVTNRDLFSHSKKSVVQFRPLSITYGWKNGNGCDRVSTGVVEVRALRETTCNHPWSGNLGYWATDLQSYMCVNPVDETPPPCETCPDSALKGNPILVPTREKVESSVDLASAGPMPLEFRRIYRSHRARDKDLWFSGYFNGPVPSSMGAGWLHNYNIHLAVAGKDTSGEIHSRSGSESGVDVGTGPLAVRIQMGDGTFNYFYRPNTGSAFVGRNKLQTLEFNGNKWVFNDGEAEIRYTFGPTGVLQEQVYRNGWRLVYAYNAQGLLAVVQNNFGQSLQFTYGGAPNGALISVTSSDQRSVSLMYSDTGFLTSVRQADGTTIQYVYTNATAKVSSLLAGRIDEQGVRYTTFKYDAEGWALSTEKAGGVDKYTVPTKDGYVDPLGTSRNHTFRIYGNELVFLGSSPAPASPSEPPIYSRTVREDGLVELEYDQSNNQSTYQWDAPRRLPVSITEAVGTPESRTTQITWLPLRRLPLSITEPGRTTTYAYDSLGNPLTQTITDTGGGSGSSGTTRTTSWTYHASGLVATETAPNGATTSYQYDSAGNLTSATNALGHVDAYTHDGAGRVLSHTAPTGLVSTYTYDARGRMLTANRGGQLTTLTYRPSGQVATASLPHGHVVTYTYDTAQRLTGWSDNRGNSGAYTLDAMGNRTREDLRNAQGQLVWRLARTINSINRVESVTLGTQTTTYGYDNNGDWVGTTNSLGQGTSLGLDALRRTKAITNAESATASLSYNALDGVTQASDFKGVATTYSRDALGNATTETSPDSGTETAQYDALGLPSTVTDALGQATTIERDLLGRPTLITHADGRTTTLRYDLTAASKGYLGEILDPSGTTTYERDTQGRVTKKTQRLINGDTRSVSYAYNPQGLLASTTYPGGQVLQNVYDTTGQITGLTWAGQLLVSGITWNPLGQPTGWSWSLPGGTAAIPATRSYNTAAQLTATDFSSYQYDAAGRIHTLTQKLWRPANTNPQATTISQATSTWTVQYSPAGRIVGFTKTTAANAPVDAATFSYDANGNRTASTRDLAGTNTSRTYGGDASHNRLLGFEQTTASTDGNSASTSVTYQYNPAGDLLGDGLTSYRYDSEGRMESASTGQGEDAPTTKYAHNGLGQRVFKTEPLYSSTPASGSSNKNLNNLLADDDEPQAEPPGLIQQILSFFSKLWSPSTSDAEKLGFSYVYAEDGSLLGEYGSGGSNSTGTAQYIYLPTASGPMPIAAVIKGQTYAVHSDHLNTPRKLTQPDGQVAWQWAYSAFGDEQPTIGAKRFTSESTTPTAGATSIPEVTFNLRYPGQYFDKETKLHYNYFRTYAPSTGRYTQGDPIGLDGGWNRFGYVGGDPLGLVDPYGLDPSILPRRSYDANDVRGGFDIDGRSLVYNPKHYDPAKASQVLLTGAMLVAPEFLAAGRAACTAAETISLYRAVGPEEFYSLINGGRFAFGPNGTTMKQFGFKLDETLKYANWSTDYAAIIRADIPRSALKDLSVSFGQIDAYIFRNGVVTVEGQRALDALNRAVISIKHAY
jgi:RHS repeat-associated protein